MQHSADCLVNNQQVWPRLCRDMDTGDIEEFARRLQALAEEGHFSLLKEHAAALLRDIDAFDVDHLTKTLRNFPAVCELLADTKDKSP